MIELFYLVLAFQNRELSLTTIPEKYGKIECLKAADAWAKNSRDVSPYKAFCIPAPAPRATLFNKNIVEPSMINPGYYCGSNNCEIKEQRGIKE